MSTNDKSAPHQPSEQSQHASAIVVSA